MEINRRHFFKISGAMAAASLVKTDKTAQASKRPSTSEDGYGCLVDTTLCVGCRKCEQACNERHGLPKPKESFEEMTVLENERRMDETSYTVVNKYYPKNIGTLTWRTRPTFVKFQCMHCNDPSCVSACIVGALTKQSNGSVIYDAGKCIGCRYCMVACPFQVPAYEYHNALTPEVRKCTFCFNYIKDGGLPACAQVCPREVMTFGEKSELLRLARWKIKNNPGKYVDPIYGEHEVGGTSWLYLSSEPFETVGFPKLGTEAPPRLTESIQHGLFQYFAAPIILYAALGGIMGVTGYLKGAKEDLKSDTEAKGDSQ
jgi:Fe-S-cluster-containing dehydrogenase component